MYGTFHCLGSPRLDMLQTFIPFEMCFAILVPCLQITTTVQTCLVVVYAWEKGQHFVACLDRDLDWPCPICGVKSGHWCSGPVVPSSYAQKALPETTVVPGSADRSAPLVGTGVLEEVAEELPPAQAQLGPSVVWVPEVQSP